MWILCRNGVKGSAVSGTCGCLERAGLQKEEHGTQGVVNGAKSYRKEQQSGVPFLGCPGKGY